MHSSNRGFTLIEMMIAIAVLAIIVSIAVPSFSRTIENARIATQTNDFITAANTARAEAIRTGAPVWFTAKGAGFADGWCVRTSVAPCGTAVPADVLDHPALAANIALTYAALPATTSFSFNRLGALVTAGDATTIELAPQGCSTGQTKRRIDINAIGRISVQRLAC